MFSALFPTHCTAARGQPIQIGRRAQFFILNY